MVIGRREKLRHVSAALWEALRNQPDEPGAPAAWTRGDILIDVRMAGPIAAAPMEPLPE